LAQTLKRPAVSIASQADAHMSVEVLLDYFADKEDKVEEGGSGAKKPRSGAA